jgi:hypothetical protein
MIRYHGGPITPNDAAIACWKKAHAMISFANPEQLPLAAEIAHSFALDNGAFSTWKQDIHYEVEAYSDWVKEWERHPGFDWCLIPDQIDGTEKDNDDLVAWWVGHGHLPCFIKNNAVPVWHMHESVSRLKHLADRWHRVAIGSSGEFAEIGTTRWWSRMAEAMEVVCDSDGRPLTRLHGLRQMDPTIFSHIPYSSVDSTMVARNIGIDTAWRGTYLPPTKETRALVLRERIEQHASAARWSGGVMIQSNLALFG